MLEKSPGQEAAAFQWELLIASGKKENRKPSWVESTEQENMESRGVRKFCLWQNKQPLTETRVAQE